MGEWVTSGALEGVAVWLGVVVGSGDALGVVMAALPCVGLGAGRTGDVPETALPEGRLIARGFAGGAPTGSAGVVDECVALASNSWLTSVLVNAVTPCVPRTASWTMLTAVRPTRAAEVATAAQMATNSPLFHTVR